MVVGHLVTSVAALDRSTLPAAHDATRELADVLVDIHDLAAGLRPAALDDGLAAALGSLAAGQPIPVTVDAAQADALDRARSATMYFVGAECLTNAARHAACSSVTITLRREADSVRMTVADDGIGGATLIAGGGLAGLCRRLASIGGTLDVGERPGGGTVVTACVPVLTP
jgi:signal transduction histidine kinase